MPVAASGGLVLYRAPATGSLSVSNPLTGASRALPTPPQGQGVTQLHAIAMYGSPYRVVLILGKLPDLSLPGTVAAGAPGTTPVLHGRLHHGASTASASPGGSGGGRGREDAPASTATTRQTPPRIESCRQAPRSWSSRAARVHAAAVNLDVVDDSTNLTRDGDVAHTSDNRTTRPPPARMRLD